MSDLSRAERVKALIKAIEDEDPRSSELVACASEVSACLVRWSLPSCIRWTVELAVDGCTKEQIEEAARLVARAVREPTPADLTTEAANLRRNARMLASTQQMLDASKALPSYAGDRAVGPIAIGVYGDIAAKLLPADGFQEEFELRRAMTKDEIAARREALRVAKKEVSA
jgi:hypothetical protein